MTDLSSQDVTERETETTSTWILLQIADSGKSIVKDPWNVYIIYRPAIHNT